MKKAAFLFFRVEAVSYTHLVFKNGCLIVCLCKLIVNIFKDKAFTVFLFRYPEMCIRDSPSDVQSRFELRPFP